MSPIRQPEVTRAKILDAALELFQTRSFHGTSLNEIVELAGITKGALFHYFKGKDDLGHAVIDEPLRLEIRRTWVAPLEHSTDPISDMLGIIEGLSQQVRECPEFVERGCPLNNLAQELSSLDPAFRVRLQSVYQEWEQAIERALRAGIAAGTVRAGIEPQGMAMALVAFMEGAIGLIKVHNSLDCLEQVSRGGLTILESLRP